MSSNRKRKGHIVSFYGCIRKHDAKIVQHGDSI